MTTTVANAIPLVPTSISRVVLTLTRGPSLLVEVVEEVGANGCVVHHVIKRSKYGGPACLVRGYIVGLSWATQIARSEAW